MRVIYAYVCLPLVLAWTPLGRQLMVSIGLSLIVGWGILVQTVSFLFPVPRPYQKYKFIPVAGEGLFSDIEKRRDSFPSGHITSLAIISMLLFAYLPAAGVISFIILILASASRVALGYHYVADMIGGIAIAYIVLFGLSILGVFGFITSFIH